MAITFIQQKKRQQYLFIALLFVIFLIMLVVVWQGFVNKGGVGGLIIQPSKEIEIRFDVLSGEALKALQSSGAEVVLPEDIGKRNPFLP